MDIYIYGIDNRLYEREEEYYPELPETYGECFHNGFIAKGYRLRG